MKILQSITAARHRSAMAREFDAGYYKNANPDVPGGRGALLKHYISTGWRLGRDPSPAFSTVQYLVANPDVAKAGVNPLHHYVLHGKSEGRAPKPNVPAIDDNLGPAADFFCDDYYSGELEGLPLLGLSPLHHYLLIGWNLGLNPNSTFDGDFYLAAHPDLAMGGVNPMLHWVTEGAREGRLSAAPGEDNPYRRALDEGLFDAEFYSNTYGDAPPDKSSSLRHYKLYGWWQYRNPSARFDAVWYHHTYMADIAAPMDPMLHYALHGRDRGYRTRPEKPSSVEAIRDKFPSDGKRICLFAGYDADGSIDDAVLTYITELSKYADVYYLADCSMEPGELSKLSPITRGAWARRHGGYDFGSWSILARDLVGWNVIEEYDELLLVNDSAFLVRPLEAVFSQMNDRDCAWWGLQATKGIAATFDKQALERDEDLSQSPRKENLLDRFEDDPIYDFLIGSYFLALRKEIITNFAFRRILDNVRPEYDKSVVIRKYEIGLGRWLISQGYQFTTFVDDLYTVQPVYTDRIFDLIAEGFPLFKRYLLTENHYDVPYLNCWRERLARAGATVDFGAIWRNTLRHADHSRLMENLHSGRRPDGQPLLAPPLPPHEIGDYDRQAPKFDHWWAFPVCAHTHSLDDNTRAMFEAVKMNPAITKIVLTRNNSIETDGVNVRVARIDSRLGQYYMARARHVFIKHTVRSNFGDAWDAEERNFYNLWHGIPLKRIGYASLDRMASLADTAGQNRKLKTVICASDVDRLAMASAHYPLTYHDMWKTGLPRHDFILMAAEELPADLREQEDRLRERCRGKKLVLFVPTFRNDQTSGYYRFSEDEIRRLSRWLEENNSVLGIREHMADTARQYSSQLSGPHFIDVSGSRFRDVEILYRNADILITDYSSCYVDFSLTGRPAISFAFDAEAYENTERGFFYDLRWAFPGPVVHSFDALITAMGEAVAHPDPDESYFFKRKIYCDYVDTGNTARVLKRVLESGRTTRLPEIALKRDEESGNILCISAPDDRAGALADAIQAIVQSEGMAAHWLGSDRISSGELPDCAAVVFVNVGTSDDVLDLCELAAIFDIPTLYVEAPESIGAEDDIPRISACKVRAAERAVVRSACGPRRSLDERTAGRGRDLYAMLDRISALDVRLGADI